MAPLRYAAKFDLFLSLDWAPTLHPGTIRGKEGIKFCHLATFCSYHPSPPLPGNSPPGISIDWADFLLKGLTCCVLGDRINSILSISQPFYQVHCKNMSCRGTFTCTRSSEILWATTSGLSSFKSWPLMSQILLVGTVQYKASTPTLRNTIMYMYINPMIKYFSWVNQCRKLTRPNFTFNAMAAA